MHKGTQIRKMQHYFALYCHNKSPKHFYTNFRNFVTGQTRQSKKDYYEHKFKAAKNGIYQTWWWLIINIINTKNRKVENIVKKIIQDVVHEDSEDIANMFNDYFVDIGKYIAESIGVTNIIIISIT